MPFIVIKNLDVKVDTIFFLARRFNICILTIMTSLTHTHTHNNVGNCVIITLLGLPSTNGRLRLQAELLWWTPFVSRKEGNVNQHFSCD